jgi:hypothetical protein
MDGPFEGGCLCGAARYSAAKLSDPGWRPEFHIWDASRLPWFDPPDRLPRHAGDR